MTRRPDSRQTGVEYRMPPMCASRQHKPRGRVPLTAEGETTCAVTATTLADAMLPPSAPARRSGRGMRSGRLVVALVFAVLDVTSYA